MVKILVKMDTTPRQNSSSPNWNVSVQVETHRQKLIYYWSFVIAAPILRYVNVQPSANILENIFLKYWYLFAFFVLKLKNLFSRDNILYTQP
jgi:hypothetical protein